MCIRDRYNTLMMNFCFVFIRGRGKTYVANFSIYFTGARTHTHIHKTTICSCLIFSLFSYLLSLIHTEFCSCFFCPCPVSYTHLVRVYSLIFQVLHFYVIRCMELTQVMTLYFTSTFPYFSKKIAQKLLNKNITFPFGYKFRDEKSLPAWKA